MEKDVIRNVPYELGRKGLASKGLDLTGERLTEAEALYIAGRLKARDNGGFVPNDMREWWLKIDAIAPSWLTGMSIMFKVG